MSVLVTHIQLLHTVFSFIRRKVLSTWKEKKGFDATYKNLLELFLKADHTECADTICTVLKRRGEYIHLLFQGQKCVLAV